MALGVTISCIDCVPITDCPKGSGGLGITRVNALFETWQILSFFGRPGFDDVVGNGVTNEFRHRRRTRKARGRRDEEVRRPLGRELFLVQVRE